MKPLDRFFAALVLLAASLPAAAAVPSVRHRGRAIDLDAFLEGFPYTSPFVDVRSSRLFYKRKGKTDELMMAAYDPASAEKVDFAKGRVISPRDFSKRNLWAIFYSPLTKTVIMKADDHNEEIMNFVALDPETGTERSLTRVGYIYDHQLSDDGRLLVYASRATKDELSPGDLRVLDLTTGKETVLFRDTPAMKMVWGGVSWRPGDSGVLVSFLADSDRNKRNLLYVPVDPAEKFSVLTDTTVKRSALSPLNVWLDADEFLYTSDEADFTGVYRGSLKGGRALVTAKGDNVKDAALLKDGGRLLLAVVTGNPLSSALKLIAPETGAVLSEEKLDGQAEIDDVFGDRLMLSRRSLSNPFSDVELRASGGAAAKTERAAYPDPLLKKIVQCDVEKVGFKTFDGLSTPGETGTLHAYLLKPKKPLPPDQERALVLSFYGGGNDYSTEFEILCSAGYYVLSPAPRGTTDFGAVYYDLAAGDLGGAETLDDFAAGKYLQERLGLPSSRIGIFGGSRGGYDTLRALTFPGEVNGVKEGFRFGFGISDFGISDIARATVGGNISQWESMLTGGDPAKNPEKWRDRSPETHADLLSGPLLLTHGTNDSRIPIVESRSFFAKAKALGKDATFVEMPGQGHGYKGLDALARYYRAVLDFLEKLR